MILTRRGVAVLGVVVLGIAMAGLYGPRALNAVVAPAAVALAAAAVLVWRVDAPDVERVVVDEGFAGETHTVELRFSTSTPFTAHIHDRVPEGLSAAGNELTTAVEDTTMAYEVTFARRGAHELGPTAVTARDVLGLAEQTFRYDATREVLVYPRVHDLAGRARHELNLLPDAELINHRGEFDSLREYQRGDALRDIEWKSSAKQPGDDLIVKEYVEEAELGEVRIAAETVEGADPWRAPELARESADAMAEAAASIALFLLAAGLSVAVSAPEGVVEPDEHRDPRGAVLELLARTGPGVVPRDERRAADVVIRADGRDVTVSLGDKQVPFERLVGDDVEAPEPTATVTSPPGG